MISWDALVVARASVSTVLHRRSPHRINIQDYKKESDGSLSKKKAGAGTTVLTKTRRKKKEREKSKGYPPSDIRMNERKKERKRKEGKSKQCR